MKRLRVTPSGVLTMAAGVALWSVAFFLLLGDLGKWADDWWWGNRDPVTGGVVSWARFSEVPRISRPFHFLLTSFMQTACWQHDWINHLATALSHGVTTCVLFVFLRRLSVPRGAAAAGAVAFLVMPWQFEVPFWNAALATSLCATTFMLMCMAQIKFQRGGWRLSVSDTPLDRRHRRPGRPRSA